jgi:hypothetical protein
MRTHKITILIALVALLLTALVAVMAQTPTQDPAKNADQAKKSESCCKDGSCPMMKKDGADMTAAGAEMKHDCCGDSCSMKKEGAANADGVAANAAGADMKHDCCGDSCDMANHAKHDMTKMDKKGEAGEAACCKMKHKDAKQKDAKEKP